MASEQDIFYKTPRQIKADAKDTLKGMYGKSIKANLLGLAVLLGVALAFALCLTLLGDYEWLQITLCIILGVLFVFFMMVYIFIFVLLLYYIFTNVTYSCLRHTIVFSTILY